MPIANVSRQVNNILAALEGAERIFEIIDYPAETDDGVVTLVNAKVNDDGSIEEKLTTEPAFGLGKQPNDDGSVSYTLVKGDVRFKNELALRQG